MELNSTQKEYFFGLAKIRKYTYNQDNGIFFYKAEELIEYTKLTDDECWDTEIDEDLMDMGLIDFPTEIPSPGDFTAIIITPKGNSLLKELGFK